MLSEIAGIEIVGQAENFHEAIGLFNELKPDVAIVDIQMPGGSGIDILKHIKNDKSPTIVIILTNYPYPQFRQRCLEEKADFFFDKSIEFIKVVDVCRGLAQS